MNKFYPFIIIISVFFLEYFSFRKMRFLLVFLLCPLIFAGCYKLNVFDSELLGTPGDDTLIGSAGADLLEGGAGDDRLEGGAGDDWLEGGAGGDRLNGGAGIDLASYSKSASGVIVNLSTGKGSRGHANGDKLTEIENLSGSKHADILTGDDNANFLKGNVGNDRLIGGAGDDRLEGGTDFDVLKGGMGADKLDGGVGYDWAFYDDSPAAVTIDLSTGRGLGGYAQGDILTNIKHLLGSDHDDTLKGNSGKINGFEGGAGGDIIDGRGGEDIAFYFSSGSGVHVNLLTDVASGGHAQGDRLTSIEHLVGSAHDDQLMGDGKNNWLSGDAGDDMIDGGTGNDKLEGGKGNDTLTGGTGSDRFVFRTGDGHDIITDAKAGEKLIFAGTTNVRFSVNVVSYGSGNTVTAEGANFRTKIDTSRDFNGDGKKDSVITVVK